MTKTIAVCMLVVGMLVFASTGFVANSSVGAPSLQGDRIESAAPTDNRVLLASYPCADVYCDDGWSCCPGYNTCCPAGTNILCPGSNMCYSDISDAMADCGDYYYPCASPVY